MTKKKIIKILYISRTSKITGAENILLDIVSGISKEYFHPVVALPDNKGLLFEKLQESGIDTRLIKMPFLKVTRNPFLLIWYAISIIIINAVFFFFIIKNRINIVSCHTVQEAFYVALPTKLSGRKLIISFKNILDSQRKKIIRAKFAGFFADKIVAVSGKAAQDFSDFNAGSKNIAKLKIVYDCIDYEDYLKDLVDVPLQSFFKTGKDDFIIANVGSLSELKGQAFLVESFAKIKASHPKIKVLLVGDIYDDRDVPYKKKLIEMLEELKLKDTVFMTGYQKNVKGILKSADVLVHCPIIDDAFPRVILEGFAMKNVVIGTKVGGIPEMIKDGYNGFLADINTEELAVKIRYVYENRKKLETIKENALNVLVTRFSLKNQLNEIEILYKGLIEGKKNG